jgi:hypothetical protein
MPTRPSRSGRRTALRWTAILIAGGLLASACSGRGHRPVPASAPGAGPTTTTTEAGSAPAPLSPYLWNRSASPALAVGGGASATLSALIAPEAGGPWLAFGTRLPAGGLPQATEWTSADASSWSASPVAPADSQADSAAVYRESVVVTGAVGQGDLEQAAVWISQAGGPFRPAKVVATDGPSVMTSVTGGALGFFATGTVAGHFALWESTNGLAWSEVPQAEQVITSLGGATVNALTSVGDTVYAAGSTQAGGVPQAALWSSSDGLNWHAINPAGGAFSGSTGRVIYSLSTIGEGLVAVGALQDGASWVPASWISPNGVSWSLPSTDFPSLPAQPPAPYDLGPSGGTAALAVADVADLDGSGFLVAAGGGPYGQDLWRSTDGLHWSPVALPEAAADTGTWRAGLVAATSTTTVVADPNPGRPYLLVDTGPGWTQPSAQPEVFGAVRPEAVPAALQPAAGGLLLTVNVVTRPQAIGPAEVTVDRFWSSDGRHWVPADPTASPIGAPPTLPAPGAFATPVAGGWVAVANRSGGAAPAIYTSSDGRTWTELGPLPLSATLPVGSPAGGSQGAPAATTTTTTTAPAVAGPAPAFDATGICSPGASGSGQVPAGSLGAGSATSARATSAPATSAPATSAPASPAPTGPATSTSSSTAIGGAPGFDQAAVVGWSRQVAFPATGPQATVAAAAWYGSGGYWALSSVSPAASAGTTQLMAGCEPTVNGLVAWGAASDGSGPAGPALWRSSDGATWDRVDASGFGPVAAAPLVSLASSGSDLVGVASADPTADAAASGIFAAAGPAAPLASGAGLGLEPSLEGGQEAVWLSTDGGDTWQQVDTSADPWLGDQTATVAAAAFTPAGTPVVAGSVDGQLVVWWGKVPTAGG